MEKRVGHDDADRHHPRQVEPFGDHLRADDDVDLVAAHLAEQVGVALLAGDGVLIPAQDARPRPVRGDLGLDALRRPRNSGSSDCRRPGRSPAATAARRNDDRSAARRRGGRPSGSRSRRTERRGRRRGRARSSPRRAGSGTGASARPPPAPAPGRLERAAEEARVALAQLRGACRRPQHRAAAAGRRSRCRCRRPRRRVRPASAGAAGRARRRNW